MPCRSLRQVDWRGPTARSGGDITNRRENTMYDQERGSQARQDVIKVALVGCGSRGTGALTQTLRTRGPIKLWAMADLFGDRLDASLASLVKGEAAAYDREAHAGFGSQLDVPPERRFVGFDAYQKAIDSGVDLVILATPPQFRPLHFEYAVKRKKHLFIEKPVAVDAPGVRRILAANEEAKRQGLKIGVGLMSRHNQCDQETVKRLQDGAIGPVMLMRCYWNTGYLRDTPPRSADMTEMAYQLRNPYHFLWLGGDYLVDALIHNIDLALWIKGAYPVSAQGQGGRWSTCPTSTATSTTTSVSNIPLPMGVGCLPRAGSWPAAGTPRPCTSTARWARPKWHGDGSAARASGGSAVVWPTLTRRNSTCCWMRSVRTNRTTRSTMGR